MLIASYVSAVIVSFAASLMHCWDFAIVFGVLASIAFAWRELRALVARATRARH